MTYKLTCPICYKPFDYDTLKAYWYQNCACAIPKTVDETHIPKTIKNSQPE